MGIGHALSVMWRVGALTLAFAGAGCGDFQNHPVISDKDFFLVDKTEINITHKNDSTSCPGPPETLAITNIGYNPMQWDLTGVPGWLDVDRLTGTFDPQVRVTINFRYNCSGPIRGGASARVFVTVVDFTAGEVVGTRPITVRVAVK